MVNGALDEWIGKHVSVLFVPSETENQPLRGGCVLESADERGVILSYHGAENLSQNYYFFPWHKIEWIIPMSK